MKYHGGINIFRYLIDCVLEVIYSRKYICVCCKQEIDFGVICKTCESRSSQVLDIENICDKKLYSCKYYSSALRTLVMNYKSKHNFEVGDYFARLLFEKIEKENLNFDYITFVPSSKEAIKRRGFDHAKYMVKELEKLNNKKVIQILYKNDDTKEQKKLNAVDRSKNLRLAFDIDENLDFLNGSTILLVDDVVTTSETLRACIKKIEKNYKVNIIVLTVIKSSI